MRGYGWDVTDPAQIPPTDTMSPFTAVYRELRAEGYDVDLLATDEGLLRCPACGTETDPADLQIDRTARFEGQSDPGDEQILLAVTCPCGRRGIFSAAYGPTASIADSAVLTKIARAARPEPHSDGRSD